MKLYIIAIILLSSVLSIKKPYINAYSSAIIKVTVNQALQVKTPNEDYIEKVSELDVPSKVKEWIKDLNASKLNSKSNIDLTYNKTIGGYARGDIYYFHKTKEEYTFKYGTADVILGPLKPQRIRKCRSTHPYILKQKCWYETVFPTYDENRFKNYVINRMKLEIQAKIYNKYKPKNTNKTKTNKTKTNKTNQN